MFRCNTKATFLWKYGPVNIKLSSEELKTISDGLENAAKYMPTDFARRPRSLKHVKKWKATECRRFLLYDGPVLLQNVLSEDKYNHFIKLHVAIKLLIDPHKTTNAETIDLAEDLLRQFVQDYEHMYGERYVSYNIHNLLHLASDVRVYGCLDNFSAFRFESFIFFLKKLLRKHNRCLAQIVRRCKELDEASMRVIKTKKKIKEPEYKNIHRSGPLVPNMKGTQYSTFDTGNYTIKCNDIRNNCVLLNNCIAVRCLNFVKKRWQYVYSR